jgi:hypothetical protein
MTYCEAFGVIAELALKLGAHPMNRHPGCWEYRVDENWVIAVNGHRDERQTKAGVRVMPFSCYVEFNGWPAGVIDPTGGIIAAGGLANETTFIAALKVALEAAPCV